MKQFCFFTIILLFAAANVFSQVLPVLLQGEEVVASGTTFYVSMNPRVGWHQIEMQVQNPLSDAAVVTAFKAKRTVISDIPGSVNYFCFDNCYGPETNESPNVIIPPGGSVLFTGDYEETPGIDDICTIRYDFFNVDYPGQPVYIIAKYLNGNASGIENVFDSQYFKIYSKNGSARISCDLRSDVVLTVYSALGQTAGSLSINKELKYVEPNFELSKGLYVYQLRENNRIIQTGKFIIN